MQKHTYTTGFDLTPKGSRGFTLAELLVAMSVFAIVVVLIGTLFVQSLRVQRRAFNFQQVEENASFVLESIAKEIRVATIDPPLSDVCPTSTLHFIHPINGIIRYQLVDTSFERAVNGMPEILNSKTIQFTRLSFCVTGAETDDNRQPRITILAGIQSTEEKDRVQMDIQTTVSTRLLSD